MCIWIDIYIYRYLNMYNYIYTYSILRLRAQAPPEPNTSPTPISRSGPRGTWPAGRGGDQPGNAATGCCCPQWRSSGVRGFGRLNIL